MLRGIATVFRGTESLGEAQYWFTVAANGAVTGQVAHVEYLNLHPAAPRIPMTFMPQQAGDATDLSLTLARQEIPE